MKQVSRESVETTREAPKRTFTINHRQKLSESMKGRKPWNKGLTKTDPRINASIDKRLANPNYRINLSKALMGHAKTFFQHSDETKNRIRNAHLGKTHDYDVWNKGLRKKTNQKLETIGRNISKSLLAKPEKWRKDTARKARLSVKQYRISGCEKEFEVLLISNKISYISQYRIILNSRFTDVDFFLPESNLCIYIDGIHWHKDKEKDTRIDTRLKELGYKVLRISVTRKGENDYDSIIKYLLDDDIVRHSK